MNSMNPGNVPAVDDARWLFAVDRKVSYRQCRELKDQLKIEGIDAAELYGEGFSSLEELSAWAAHWGISLLHSRSAVRHLEQARRAYEQEKEDRMKAMIADIFRAKNPELRRNYVFE